MKRPAPARARRSTLDRRHFVLLGASTLLLSACQSGQRDPGRSAPARQPGSTSHTIDDLFATTPFYIAHRGSGDNWAEHTMEAYSKSVALGVKALEISVNATSDGTLICHHDTTMERTSGENVTIADTTWSELSRLRIDARAWLGPAAVPQTIPKLADALDAFAATHVIFIEDKQGTNTTALLDLMDRYPDSRSHFVWKQWAGAGQYRYAVKRGYRTWGYFGPDDYARLGSLAANFDYLGVLHSATDSQVKQLVATGKPVIAWEIHYRWMRDRMLALGVPGMMCSNIPYVALSATEAASDAFASGLRAPGDLPWTADEGWSVQPTIEAPSKSISVSRVGVQSYLMGSMCPVTDDSYTISFGLRWPDALPQSTEHAGIAFGARDDRPYRVGVIGDSSGYHLVLRANGSLELYRRAAGIAAGTRLAIVQTAVPTPAEWIHLSVTVSPTGVLMARPGSAQWSVTALDSTYRGKYFWLCKNYADGPAVEFRNIAVTATHT